MTYHVTITEPTTLRDDLLEDSARVFHRHCAIIQRVFHERWLQLVGDLVGIAQIENPDANPALVEAWARNRLQDCRLALREKQDAFLEVERARRSERDAAIHAYAALGQSVPETTAAA